MENSNNKSFKVIIGVVVLVVVFAFAYLLGSGKLFNSNNDNGGTNNNENNNSNDNNNNNNNNNQNTEPVDEYTKAELKSIKTYDNVSAFDSVDDKILVYYSDCKKNQIIAKNGKLLDTPTTVDKYHDETCLGQVTENENGGKTIKYGNITVYEGTIEENSYYIDANGNKSKEYFNVQYDSNYVIFGDEDGSELIDVETGKIMKFDKKYNSVSKCEYNDCIRLCNDFEYCHLIDLEGNYLISKNYGTIEERDYNVFYVEDFKGTKMVDINGKPLGFKDFDDIYYEDDYYILLKKNKLSIVYDDKTIVDNKLAYSGKKIDVSNSRTSYIEVIDNNLYITDFKSNWNGVTYMITPEGKTKSVKYALQYGDPYFYAFDKNNNMVLYNKNLEVADTIKTNIKKNSMVFPSGRTAKDKMILFDYYSDEGYLTVDLINKKVRDSIDEDFIQYYDNGIGYLIKDEKIVLYKNNDVIKEYEGKYEYLGNTYFAKNNTLYEIVFIK